MSHLTWAIWYAMLAWYFAINSVNAASDSVQSMQFMFGSWRTRL